ncbi:MAG: FKBP-type peptidyl-prolyl cis-trans isomerase [Bacteroidales bacterium]|nr:FKBP-type peptidyl-prolyl cis-trans isomerase [Bacteroidales bacterium]
MSLVLRYLKYGLFFALIILFACSKDDPDVIAERDRNRILKYLEENEFDDYYELESGVFIVMEVEGSGSKPGENSIVNMSYVGKLLNGTIFDGANYANVNLKVTVRGFRYGVMEFSRGGQGMILIPSALGYGSNPYGSIPRNSVLIFEVEIYDFYNN